MAEWKIRRGDDEFTAPDVETLRGWAAEGRVVGSDYVMNPMLNRWMYASEAVELAGIYSRHAATATANHWNRTSFAVAALGFLLLFLYPLAGGIVLVVALVMSVLVYFKRQ